MENLITIVENQKLIDLVVSLPVLHHPFRSRDLPIFRRELDKRLSILSPDHLQLLAKIEQWLRWSNPMVIDFADELLNVLMSSKNSGYRLLAQCARWRLDVIFLIAALRVRQRGMSSWQLQKFPVSDRCAAAIKWHWLHPTYQLHYRYPWLKRTVELLEQDDPLALERYLMQITWDYYSRCWDHQQYDFASIVLYLLRWDLIDNAMSYNAEVAKTHFEALVEHNIGSISEILGSINE